MLQCILYNVHVLNHNLFARHLRPFMGCDSDKDMPKLLYTAPAGRQDLNISSLPEYTARRLLLFDIAFSKQICI